jgi:hypothetical protein
LEPEIVRQEDSGNVSGLDDIRLPFNKAFNAMVKEVITLTRDAYRTSVESTEQ